jgi:hypothetical protein
MVQVVHYPMFDRVGTDQFARYAQDHARLITPIVGIPMLIELSTAAALLWMTPAPASSRAVLWIGLAMVLAIWLITALVSVPCHQQLAGGFEPLAHGRLVWTNWLRTGLWSARGLLVAWLLWTQIQTASA